MMKPQYILVINHIIGSVFRAAEELRKQPEFANVELLVLTTHPERYESQKNMLQEHILPCTYGTQDEIAAVLAPFIDDICAVICRGDKHIQYLRKVIPLLPKNVLVSTPDSLADATNKRRMRQDFLAHAPAITPQFIQVHDASAKTVQQVEAHLQYPVIVKPADLASSLLIQSCRTRQELEGALHEVYTHIAELYTLEEREDVPQVIVEEYLEGEFYSIDAYVDATGTVTYCPPVGYIPAKQLGIDDFFLYKRFVPVALSDAEVATANTVAKQAIQAVGLTNTTVHVELVRTAHGWKIIELGPRIGRFRTSMYGYAYDIDHSLNDVKIHLGLSPDIPQVLKRYCSAYSIYPSTEGTLISIQGFDALQKMPEVVLSKVFAQPGDQCTFAKHGGHALAEFVIATADEKRFQELTKYIESTVKADIDQK